MKFTQNVIDTSRQASIPENTDDSVENIWLLCRKIKKQFPSGRDDMETGLSQGVCEGRMNVRKLLRKPLYPFMT